MENFNMNIKDKIKRLYYRLKNSDPVNSCPAYKKDGCAFVDDPYCKPSDCIILCEVMGDKWVGCVNCAYQDECSSKDFGLGCFEGEEFKEETK